MRMMRSVPVAVILVAGALGITGCAGDPDLAPLEAELSAIDGTSGAIAWVNHSGAPWNTQVNIQLFMDDLSDEDLIEAVQAAAPILAADPTAGRTRVTIRFVDGDRDDYADHYEASADDIPISAEVAEALGLRDPGTPSLVLSPADVDAIAQE